MNNLYEGVNYAVVMEDDIRQNLDGEAYNFRVVNKNLGTTEFYDIQYPSCVYACMELDKAHEKVLEEARKRSMKIVGQSETVN